MTQQTAVEWLWRWQMDNEFASFKEGVDAYKKAKAMEEEQIMKSFISGGYDGLHFPKVREAFDRKYLEDKFFEYFKETYGEVH